MSKSTVALILVGLFFILLGYFFIDSFYLKNSNELPGDSNAVDINKDLLAKIILILSVLMGIGLFLLILQIRKITSNFSLYLINPFLVREKLIALHSGDMGGISAISYRFSTYLSTLMFPLSVLGGIMAAQEGPKRHLGKIPIILVIVYSVVNLNRFAFITSLGLWLLSLLYFIIFVDKEYRQKMIRRITWYIIIAFLLVVAFFVLILKLRTITSSSIEDFAIRSIYSYFSGSGSALEKFLFFEPRHVWGASSFRSIFRWLTKFGLVDKSLVFGTHNVFTNVSVGQPLFMNTYTFIKSPFEDFGLIGVGVICSLWGMIARYLLERYFRKFSIGSLFWVSIMTFSFFMSFYEFFFQNLTLFVYWFLILYLVQYIMERHEEKKYEKI